MSIPLSRLYNFFDSISDHDLIIYVWTVHGSKKLRDLNFLKPISKSWRDVRKSPALVFHDQEPLDFDFLQCCVDQDFINLIRDRDNFPLLSAPLVQEHYKKTNIKSVLEILFYDLWALVHSEKNSQQVAIFEKNNFVPVYYWSHAVIARDWFRFAEHDPLLKIKNSESKTFLIYNRAWQGTREYRIKFSEMLINSELHQDAIVSFSKKDDGILYTDHQFKNKKFKPNRTDLENILIPNNHGSAASADYNSADYQSSMIEVVLETLFDDDRHHLTEKSLRPIACGQPFILAGTAGSLQYLRDYGFKTFSGYINETYDTIQDPCARLEAIISEMKRISAMSTGQKKELAQGMQSIADHNQQLFFSPQFQNQIISEFKTNLDTAMTKIRSGPVGRNWEHLRSIAQQNYPELFFKHMHQDPDDLAWAHKWIRSHIKT
jgi:hypothetical protein